MLSINYNGMSNAFDDVNVRAKNNTFNIPLFLDNNKIMIGMQKDE